MDRDPEKLNFPVAIWTVVLTLGALHLSGSLGRSARPFLSGRAFPEPFARPLVAFTQVSADASTPASSRSFARAPHGARVKRFSSSLKTFFYEPLGHLFRVEKAKPGSHPKTIRKV